MARGSFFGRIGRAIRNIVAPPQPPREREQAPPPPEQPPEREAPSGREWRAVWRDERGKGSYRKNLAVFHRAVDPIEPDPYQQLELWETYVRHMNRPSRVRRQSVNNPFWRESGLDPADFNWQAWRQAMGYTGKRRSRTP